MKINAIAMGILLISSACYASEQPISLSQQDSFTYEKVATFNDQGKIKTAWQPQVLDGYGILGHVVTSGTEVPKFVSVTVNLDELNNNMTANPVDFRLIKSFSGSDGEPVSLWHAICPQNFLNKGYLVTTAAMPNTDDVYCIAADLITESEGKWLSSHEVEPRHHKIISNDAIEPRLFGQDEPVQSKLRSLATASMMSSYTNWMGQLKDSTSIGNITIPGTHDSGAYRTSALFETQTWSPQQQLNNGIRFLDIRLSDKTGSSSDFELRHGEGRLGSFKDLVLDRVNTFLLKNPSEVIFMSVKHEQSNIISTGSETFDKARFYRDYILPADSRFYKSVVTGSTTLGSLRGKIVLLDRYDAVDERNQAINIGIKYPRSYFIQDEYNLDFECQDVGPFGELCGPHVGLDYPGKYKKVLKHLDRAWDNSGSANIWINFTSATYNTGYEIDNARLVNGRLKNKLNALAPGVSIGTIFPMDYPEETPGIIDSMINMSISAHGLASKQPVMIPNRSYDSISSIDGFWGEWGNIAKCPAEQYVKGYRLRSEPKQGDDDDTALNDIELYCSPLNSSGNAKIYSAFASWGTYSADTFCSGNNNPVIGFDIKIEPKQGDGDDTAANDVDLYCKSGVLSASVNTSWGNWSPVQYCPTGKAVVGIVTRVEGKQGSEDDTALNGVRLICENY
ncbi:hypothetical protein [Aeromonas cavernicola]|nr:hypothetical protein [Aeromonas cavernicola]